MREVQGASERSREPRLGLRFDRGRTELVLESSLALPSGLRLDAMRTELAPLSGRLSLTEGWRAFRHRRSSLVSATWSIGLVDLAQRVERALGVSIAMVALGEQTLSIAASGEAMVVASELAWGWDDEDLLVVVGAARSLPHGPRAPIAIAHDLAVECGASFDRERGVLRWHQPLRRALLDALAPVGLRVPSTAGLVVRSAIEGERFVSRVESVASAPKEATRAELEAARVRAPALVACLDLDGPPPIDSSPTVRALDALSVTLATPSIDADVVARAAIEYATIERQAAMASAALMTAAEHAGGRAAELASLAIERGGLTRPEALARAVERVASDASRSLGWERLALSLATSHPIVERARALALSRAGRVGDALAIFAELSRTQRDDVVVLAGLARTLGTLGRHDDETAAWDRVASVTEGDARDRAMLAAAEATRHAGHVASAIARLRPLRAARRTDVALAAHANLVASVEVHEGMAAVHDLDRSLPALTDASGAVDASLAADLLRAALARAIAALDAGLARSLRGALERVLGDAATDEIAAHDAAIAAIEQRTLIAGDAASLRAKADALRASGRGSEAARVLIEVFAQTRDAAFLRAAIELADRSTDREVRAAVFDRALELLPAGPAREAISARRGAGQR
jgi:hypothetical protein